MMCVYNLCACIRYIFTHVHTCMLLNMYIILINHMNLLSSIKLTDYTNVAWTDCVSILYNHVQYTCVHVYNGHWVVNTYMYIHVVMYMHIVHVHTCTYT